MYFSKHRGLVYNSMHHLPIISESPTKDILSGTGVSVSSEKKDDEQRIPLERLVQKLQSVNVKKK